MGNGQTRSGYRKRDNWYYLDKLPQRLRLALCNAAYTWDAKWFYDRWNGGKSVDWCIDKIREADLDMAMSDVKWRDGFKWNTMKTSARAAKVKPLSV